MKETFDFSRFWKYFLYDNRQMWRHNSRNLLIISGLGLLTYVVWILCGVIFNQTWMGPSMAVRLTVFVCSWLGLIFFQTKSYGYLTDKAAGSAWLMLPASRTEKFVSMLLITLVEMPVFLVLVFGGIDALVTALGAPSDLLCAAVGALEGRVGASLEPDSACGTNLVCHGGANTFLIYKHVRL